MSDQKRGFMLTTDDNPHSPFDAFPQWYRRDLELGHDTCGLLSRMTNAAPGVDDDEAAQYAMADIVMNNFSGRHVMVVREDYDPYLKPSSL